jgi:hypothetical protein
MVDRSHYFASGADWPSSILEAWRWLIGPQSFLIVRVTAMGSLFLQDPAGAIFFLDTTEASFERVADSADAFESLFDSSNNRRALLWSFFVRELRQRGIELKQGECYGWKLPPCLGGKPNFDNVEPTDIGVHVSMQGQIHQQVRAMPPGTRIDKIDVIGPT